MRIPGSVALVTGASSGIGRESAIRLAARGARVLVHGRDPGRLAEVAGRVGGVPFVADLTEPGAALGLATAVLERVGQVDILVNNAGVGLAGPAGGVPQIDVERLVTVNLTAPMTLTRALLPQFLARDEGYLLFVSSIAGRMGVARESVYSATKAGVDVFAESLRLELAATRIRVGVLVPGVVETAFFDRRGEPYRRRWPRALPVGRAADALVDMVDGDRAERYLPSWLRIPVTVRGALPGVYRRLGSRFGG